MELKSEHDVALIADDKIVSAMENISSNPKLDSVFQLLQQARREITVYLNEMNRDPKPLAWSKLQIRGVHVAQRGGTSYKVMGNAGSWEAYANGKSLGTMDTAKNAKRVCQGHADLTYT